MAQQTNDGLLRRGAPRNDGKTQLRDLAAGICPSFTLNIPPSNQRAQGMPGARCARSRACRVESTRVSHHGHTGITRHSPRNGFTVSFVISPVIGFLATVACASSHRLDASTVTSGPHDLAVRIWYPRLWHHPRP